ncbi:MAG: AAA family ATPase [Parcubacteria group bacterium]|nr:AAA family ATPase [Parcubacteria group bacterium]
MKQFLIIIDGPMGSGKTTIGTLVHKKLKRTALVSTDRIKWFVSDFKRGAEDNKMTAEVLYAMCEEYIKHGISLLIPQGFWKKEYVDTYINLAKKHNLELFVYQLETPKEILLKRLAARPTPALATSRVPKTRILKNLKTWEENRYNLGKIFDTSKQSAEQITKAILKEVKSKI